MLAAATRLSRGRLAAFQVPPRGREYPATLCVCHVKQRQTFKHSQDSALQTRRRASHRVGSSVDCPSAAARPEQPSETMTQIKHTLVEMGNELIPVEDQLRVLFRDLNVPGINHEWPPSSSSSTVREWPLREAAIGVDEFLAKQLDMDCYVSHRSLFTSDPGTCGRTILDICVHAIQHHEQSQASAVVIGVSSRFFRIYSRSEVNCQYMADRGIISTMCTILNVAAAKEHANSSGLPPWTENCTHLQPDFIGHSFATLANLALVASNREQMRANEVVQMLMKQISICRSTRSDVVELLAALSNLSSYDENVNEIIRANGPHLILSILKDPGNYHNRDLLLHGFYVLSSLTKIEFSQQDRMALSLVVQRVILHFPHDGNLLSVLLCVLANGCSNEFRPSIEVAKSVLEIVWRFQYHPNILTAAFHSLAQVLNRLDLEHVSKIIQRDAIDRMASIANRHAERPNVQSAMCFVWSVLSRSPSLRKSLVECGVLTHILSQMSNEQGTDFDAGDEEILGEGHIVLGSHVTSFNRIDMTRLFCAISLMQLSESGDVREELLRRGTIFAILDCAQSATTHKQLQFFLQFIFQRLVRKLDSPSIYLYPAAVPSLRSLAAFALKVEKYGDHNNVNIFMKPPSPCSLCGERLGFVEAVTVDSSSGLPSLDGFKRRLICAKCVKKDRESLFARFKSGNGVIQLVGP